MRRVKSVVLAAAALIILGGCSSYSATTSAMDDAAGMHPSNYGTTRLVAGDALGGTLVDQNPRLLAQVRARQTDNGYAGAETVRPRD
jgi:uncharacterized protein YceK